MQDAMAVRGGIIPTQSRVRTLVPDLEEWLREGRLTLVDERRQTVSFEKWGQLPADVRERVLTDFENVVRASTKAAVIFLR